MNLDRLRRQLLLFSLCMALVTVLGCVVLQEALTLPKIAGIVLITAGAFVLSR